MLVEHYLLVTSVCAASGSTEHVIGAGTGFQAMSRCRCAWQLLCCRPLDGHHVVTGQAEPDDEDEAEDSDGEDFLLKGPRSDLELRCDQRSSPYPSATSAFTPLVASRRVTCLATELHRGSITVHSIAAQYMLGSRLLTANTWERTCRTYNSDDVKPPERRLKRLEHLTTRRPELLSSVMLRQNPHNVHEWHKRVHLFPENPTRQILVYTEAVKTVDSDKARILGLTCLQEAAMLRATSCVVSAIHVLQQAAAASNHRMVGYTAIELYDMGCMGLPGLLIWWGSLT